VAVAVALLMIGGEFDLSAGVMTGSTALVTALLAVQVGWNVWLALLVSLVFALAVGAINGWLVVWTRLPSFIITIGTFLALQGINLGVTRLVTGAVQVAGVRSAGGYSSAGAVFASTTSIGDARFQVSTLWWIALTIIAAVVLVHTPFGNWVFALGGSPVSAREVGVPVVRTKITLFMTIAAASWLVGSCNILSIRQRPGQPGYRIGVSVRRCRGGRRLSAQRWLRVRSRRCDRCAYLRDGTAGDRVRALGHRLVHAVPRHPTALGGASEHRVLQARRKSTPMTALIETLAIAKSYGGVVALRDVSTVVNAGEVTCVLGDNGAGKSTLIKILAGLHQHDSGELRIDGEPTRLSSPRAALDRGIATVYQDLGLVPLMSVWRNFVLGSEPATGLGSLRLLDRRKAQQMTRDALSDMGIDIQNLEQPVGTLSGGQRQCIAIARAVHYGAKVLILDEPTAALGVKQAGAVLRHVVQARDRGLGVILITHNPHHAYPVGDRFLLLERGSMHGSYHKSEIELPELTHQTRLPQFVGIFGGSTGRLCW
jgi:simple sugar transport system ATP-binding protein